MRAFAIFLSTLLYCPGATAVINRGCMAFTEDDMKALRLLLREELQAEVRPFRNEVGKRFDEVATQMDGLYQRDEKREQEYLSIREQIRRLEARFA